MQSELLECLENKNKKCKIIAVFRFCFGDHHSSIDISSNQPLDMS